MQNIFLLYLIAISFTTVSVGGWLHSSFPSAENDWQTDDYSSWEGDTNEGVNVNGKNKYLYKPQSGKDHLTEKRSSQKDDNEELKYETLSDVENQLIDDLTNVIIRKRDYKFLLNNPKEEHVRETIKSSVSRFSQKAYQAKVLEKLQEIKAYFTQYVVTITNPTERKRVLDFLNRLKEAHKAETLGGEYLIKLTELHNQIPLLLLDDKFSKTFNSLLETFASDKKDTTDEVEGQRPTDVPGGYVALLKTAKNLRKAEKNRVIGDRDTPVEQVSNNSTSSVTTTTETTIGKNVSSNTDVSKQLDVNFTSPLEDLNKTLEEASNGSITTVFNGSDTEKERNETGYQSTTTTSSTLGILNSDNSSTTMELNPEVTKASFSSDSSDLRLFLSSEESSGQPHNSETDEQQISKMSAATGNVENAPVNTSVRTVSNNTTIPPSTTEVSNTTILNGTSPRTLESTTSVLHSAPTSFSTTIAPPSAAPTTDIVDY